MQSENFAKRSAGTAEVERGIREALDSPPKALTSKAHFVFHQQDGDVTKAYYESLAKRGPVGQIAVALFRAQKRSSRAKDYRRGKFRAAAYDVKSWSMSEVCRLLAAHGDSLGFTWGWQQDKNVVFDGGASWVLYVDIPIIGQVSFHSPDRMAGPDYPGKWDGLRGFGESRIIQFCDLVSSAGAP